MPPAQRCNQSCYYLYMHELLRHVHRTVNHSRHPSQPLHKRLHWQEPHVTQPSTALSQSRVRLQQSMNIGDNEMPTHKVRTAGRKEESEQTCGVPLAANPVSGPAPGHQVQLPSNSPAAAPAIGQLHPHGFRLRGQGVQAGDAAGRPGGLLPP